MTSTNSSSSLLAQISLLTAVDIDSNDVGVAEKHSPALPGGKFRDMTSNQAIVYTEVIRQANVQIVQSAVGIVADRKDWDLEKEMDAFVEDVVDVFTVLIGKTVYSYLDGYVHAQVSPAYAYDTPKTVEHAQQLVRLYISQGIPIERVCIKIPSTPESLLACKKLQLEGINTLATGVFCVAQAVAASQAGCVYVAPYFNELRVHFDKSVWKDCPPEEHPATTVIRSIIETFKNLGTKTLVMPASIVTANEALALAALKPDHLTLSASVLDLLASLPPVPEDQLQSPPRKEENSSFRQDYLANDASLLRDALEQDQETMRKVKDALLLFGECEERLKTSLRQFVTAL